jgi:hypothetical protein
MNDMFNVIDIEVEGWRPIGTHPLAELFPSLSPDDFAALVEDIKENGQQFSIVVDQTGLLIDGRMRLAACEKAGVEPAFEFLEEGQDPVAFIWSANGKRRQMTKGQMAMIAAAAFTVETTENNGQRGRPSKGHAAAAKAAGVSAERFSHSLSVREFAPHLMQEVINGQTSLDEAYKQALANKKAREWRDDGLRMLRGADRDLAQRVEDQEITIEDARRALDERRQAIAVQRDSVLIGISTGVAALAGFDKSPALQDLPNQLKTEEGEEHLRRYFKGGLKEIEEKLEVAERGLAALKETLSRRRR